MADESSITRLAIEEIVREMHENKQRELQPPLERKQNPLGRPNKRFLGRTLTSIVTHNRREAERTEASCRRKLKDLNKRRHRRDKYAKRPRKLRAISISSSSSSESSPPIRHRRTKKRRRSKMFKQIEHSYRKSRSMDSSKKGNETNLDNYIEEEVQYHNGTECGFYVAQPYDPYTLYNMSVAASAYSQLNQLIDSQLPSSAAKSKIETASPQLLKIMKSSSESVSSLDGIEDENGILTFNVSSDDSHMKAASRVVIELESDNTNSSSLSAIDNISIGSHSSRSQSEIITALTSCSSKPENEPTARRQQHEKMAPTEILIDLTED